MQFLVQEQHGSYMLSVSFNLTGKIHLFDRPGDSVVKYQVLMSRAQVRGNALSCSSNPNNEVINNNVILTTIRKNKNTRDNRIRIRVGSRVVSAEKDSECEAYQDLDHSWGIRNRR